MTKTIGYNHSRLPQLKVYVKQAYSTKISDQVKNSCCKLARILVDFSLYLILHEYPLDSLFDFEYCLISLQNNTNILSIVRFEQTPHIGPSGDNAAGVQREQIAVVIAFHSLQIASASNSR